MHDRAADPIGAATSATAVATEIMILLSIEVRIAQVRLPVEESVQSSCALTLVLFHAMAGNLHSLRAFFSLAISSSHLQ
jgi:hypothetical protein